MKRIVRMLRVGPTHSRADFSREVHRNKTGSRSLSTRRVRNMVCMPTGDFVCGVKALSLSLLFFIIQEELSLKLNSENYSTLLTLLWHP